MSGQMPKLTRPEPEHRAEALAYRQEHFDRGEMQINGDGGLDEAGSYEAWMEIQESVHNLQTVGEDLVPATTYFAVTGDRIVGTLQIRHALNDYLFRYAGHIGYGVRPCERGKGYATAMLAEALGLCRVMGLDRVLITCDRTNIASARVIQKNGGILENEATKDSGEIVQRYWIDIGDKNSAL